MSITTKAHELTIEVRPGEGGEDACHFARQLFEALAKYIRRVGGQAHPETAADSRTLRLRAELKCAAEADKLRALAGTHRIQRVPVNDKRGRRHTSAATICVLERKTPTATRPSGPNEELVVEGIRGHGRGGQRRNKVETGVRVSHPSSGLVITRTRGRHRSQNLEAARAELARRLAESSKRRAAGEVNATRRSQVLTSDRSAKSFTHNAQRDETTCHEDGRRWKMADFLAGRI